MKEFAQLQQPYGIRKAIEKGFFEIRSSINYYRIKVQPLSPSLIMK